jgi:hypothetical protein
LVRVKSRTITLAVGEDCDAATLLEKSLNKHAQHHKQFDKYCKYVLLYHDMTMVKNLPRSTTPFVLSKYQKDLLIPYSKMYFWLCIGADFENSISEDSIDNEIEEIAGLGQGHIHQSQQAMMMVGDMSINSRNCHLLKETLHSLFKQNLHLYLMVEELKAIWFHNISVLLALNTFLVQTLKFMQTHVQRTGLIQLANVWTWELTMITRTWRKHLQLMKMAF